MATSTQALGAPPFLNAEREKDPFIRRVKEPLARTWSASTMNGLFNVTYLAYFLAALDRGDEAEEIGIYLAKRAPFNGNANLWAPVGYSIALRGRLRRVAGRPAEAMAALQPILDNPVEVARTRDEGMKRLNGIPAALEEAANQKLKKAAADGMARWLLVVCLHLEMAHAKKDGYRWVPIDSLETQWKEWMGKLGARLHA